MLIVDAHLDLAYNALRGREVLRPAAEQTADDEGVPSVGLPDLAAGGVGLICATIFCEPGGGREAGLHDAGRGVRRLLPAARLVRGAGGRRAVPIRYLGGRSPIRRGRVRTRGRPIACRPAAGGGGPVPFARTTCGPSSTPACASSASPGGGRATPAAPVHPARSRPRASRLVRELDRFGIIHDALAPGRGIVLATARHERRAGDRVALQLPGHRPHRPATVRRHGPAVFRRGGVVGINFFDKFLLPPAEYGKRRATLADVARHVRHFCDLAGDAKHVGLGTDMDGGLGRDEIPVEVRTHRRPAARRRRHCRRRVSPMRTCGGSWVRTGSRSFGGRASAPRPTLKCGGSERYEGSGTRGPCRRNRPSANSSPLEIRAPVR